jgi:hypothetical protein
LKARLHPHSACTLLTRFLPAGSGDTEPGDFTPRAVGVAGRCVPLHPACLAASRSAASRRLMGRSADRDHNPNHQSAPRNAVRALQHRSYLALAVSYLALVIGIIIRIIRVLETRCEPRCTRDVPVLAGYRCIERRAEHSEAIYVAIGQPTVTSVRARGAKDAPEIHTHCGRRISCVLALLASSMSRQTCGHPVISEYDESLYAISSKRELRLQRREEC